MKEKKHVSKTDWTRFDEMKDEDIDYSDILELSDDFWNDRKLMLGGKKPISLRIDMDVYESFNSRGKGYQTAMDKVLRQYMEAQKRLQR